MKVRVPWYPWLPLGSGLICAALAVYLMQVYIDQQLDLHAPEEQRPILTQVIVASRALPPATVIELQDLSARKLPPAGLAADSFPVHQVDSLIGSILQHPVASGQPIQALHLKTSRALRLADVLADGSRAFTLSVSSEQSNAGMIRRGDTVDFYDLSEPVPTLLASDIEVIATGTDFIANEGELVAVFGGGQASDYRTLTFAVPVQQLAHYEQLQRQRALGFWLRPPGEAVFEVNRSALPVSWIIGGQNEQDWSLSRGLGIQPGEPWL